MGCSENGNRQRSSFSLKARQTTMIRSYCESPASQKTSELI
ncbi:hypothetical protein T12_5245 [Trichinella patagoniensis]|uniref:Uncharacterized protein n=1 Tax=Trichinella patagoniensis TaxID=990121 RepID=A0A0V0YV34_9BILA|nr:hypothetical protein T12_5245 [Trichinella patagoniensis]